MTLVPSHYVHFLVLGTYDRGYGWYAPKELPAGAGVAYASLAVPVTKRGERFAGYWAWVVTLDEGAPRLLDEPFELRPAGDLLEMDLISATIRFKVAPMPPARYRGTLSHPDFQDPLRGILPIEDEAYAFLFPRDKAIIIGVDPDEYQ
ncbi:hypothetical protein [Polyangium mundeleinium]|uniref:Uncharacterized protein n=1 Tax=Polyangium mundeleinium TaxID=2995306 RepID=A0ABT5EGD8_9BACT|nr:hypothetical protein [Polyangium mundeleinium]MDC0740884.1 hypothetical protein [Polyangium mundeleinium]